MKAQRILFIAICLVVSCKEEDPQPNLTIVGTWKLHSICGGFAGTCNDVPSSTDVIITFTETEIIPKGEPAVPYTVVAKVVEPFMTHYEILSDQKTSHFTVREDTLTTDGTNSFIMSYKRIK